MTVVKLHEHGRYIGYCEERKGYIYLFGGGFWKVTSNVAEPLTPSLRK